MIKNLVTIDETIDFLNELFEVDGQALFSLINSRVLCNDALARHPSLQVGKEDDGYRVGLIGILNGLFGADEHGYGPIMISIDAKNASLHAFRTPRRKESNEQGEEDRASEPGRGDPART